MLAMLALLAATQAALVPTPKALAPSPTPAPALTRSAKIEIGRQLTMQNCATCHAIGRRGLSPDPIAPQFRYLSRKYPIETLSEAFAEGILVGHSVMPQFEFAPDQVEGLVAYLKGIQVPPRKPRKKR